MMYLTNAESKWLAGLLREFSAEDPYKLQERAQAEVDNRGRYACVVAVGSPWDGIRLEGPFEDADSAQEWAERATSDPWEIVTLMRSTPGK